MLDLRKLFSKYRVEWRDRGANVSRGNIVVCCPWCGLENDRSGHLAISEETGYYFCFRNPNHAGLHISGLLHKLHIPVEGDTKIAPSVRTTCEERDYSAFCYFDSAAESDEAISYLESRFFRDPVDICRRFNLRVSQLGKWAGRLIIPLTVGWTGRAMRPHLQPRYKAWTDETGLLIIPGGSPVCLLEGALDCFRLASVTRQYTIIGVQGQRISASLLLYLKEHKVSSVRLIPDADVQAVKYLKDLQELRTALPHTDVKKLAVKSGYKDLCEMGERDVREWFIEATRAS